MDQQDFRRLIGTHDATAASSSSAADEAKGEERQGSGTANAAGHGAQASRTLFGQQRRRTGQLDGQGGSDEHRKLVPPHLNANRTQRHAARENEGKDGGSEEGASSSASAGPAYTDRAEARRKGVQGVNEYDDVEQLRRDFERRIEEAQTTEERLELQRQMAFLGGDEKHTILVKGLDFALLEQQKAKAHAARGDGDDQLEKAFTEGQSEKSAGLPKGAPTKRSIEATRPEAMNAKKFKPIGQQQTASHAAEEASPQYIWRDGKRMRKKKKDRTKVDQQKNEPVGASASTVRPRAIEVSKKTERKIETQSYESLARSESKDKKDGLHQENLADEAKEPVLLNEEEPPADRDDKMANVEESDDDDDDDIFAGAGRWEGLQAEADSDDENTS